MYATVHTCTFFFWPAIQFALESFDRVYSPNERMRRPHTVLRTFRRTWPNAFSTRQYGRTFRRSSPTNEIVRTFRSKPWRGWNDRPWPNFDDSSNNFVLDRCFGVFGKWKSIRLTATSWNTRLCEPGERTSLWSRLFYMGGINIMI